MKTEEQRIAIAEACRWLVNDDGVTGISPINVEQGLTNPKICSWKLPDYLHDLNAMHEAEKILTENQLDYYAEWLKDGNSSGGFPSQLCHWHATAVQRAEAFLRTIGKWTTNPNEL